MESKSPMDAPNTSIVDPEDPDRTELNSTLFVEILQQAVRKKQGERESIVLQQ